MRGPPFTHIRNIPDAREAAKRRLPRGLFEHIDRGCEDEVAVAANRARLDAVQLTPSVLKGILRVEDARTALSHGVDAIVVSNHGARNLDCAPGPTEVWPAMVAAVGERLDVLADGGVRRDSDVARFLAPGARGVLIGRATLYGVAIGGVRGASGSLTSSPTN